MPVRVLVIDVGGTNVKLYPPEKASALRFPSGKKMTATVFARKANKLVEGWKFDCISIGFPGQVVDGKPSCEPQNLGGGWLRADFAKVFGRPVRIINDAAMQALGCYRGGRMLFVGLGTGVGSTLILDDVVIPLELGELYYSRGQKLDAALGKDGLERNFSQWKRAVEETVETMKRAFAADYVVLGGGNTKLLKKLPPGVRRGSNKMAQQGGVRLWGGAPITAKIQKHILTIA